jgi:hypothetical protein
MPEVHGLWLIFELVDKTLAFNLVDLPQPEVLDDFDSVNDMIGHCHLEVGLDADPEIRVFRLAELSELAVLLAIDLVKDPRPVFWWRKILEGR